MDNQPQAVIPITSSLLEEDPDFIDLVENFVNKLPTLISNLRTSFHSSDWETMKKQVHDLKSTGGGHGYPQITEVATEIEAGILERQYDGIPALLNHMDVLCERIKLGFPAS